MSTVKCEICGNEVNGYKGLVTHLRYTHKGVTSKDYYDKYCKKDENEGKCKCCGKPTTFLNINVGYSPHCGFRCGAIDPDVQENITKTKFEKFIESIDKQEFINYYKTHSTNNTAKHFKIRHYQVDKLVSFYKLDKHTKEEDKKFTDEHRIMTCNEIYGTDYVFQSPIIKEKIENTMEDRYGAKNILASDYGKQKKIETFEKNYGVDNPWKAKEIIDKIKEKSPESHKKRWETMKKNGTCNTSKPEEIIYNTLIETFNEVDRQHREKRYPFACDFYIPELDLFIEYNGTWTHYTHWYNENSEEDILRVQKLKEKIEETNSGYYKSALNCFTKGDIKKRNTARENNLNYVVLWNMQDFEDWMNEGYPIRKDQY